MSTQEEIFSKGDWIVHANYGVGQVRRKEKKILEGVKKVFFRVKTFNGVYWLPVKNTDVPHIRPVASEYQIRKALSLIRMPPNVLTKDYKQRGQEISETLQDGSLYSIAQVIRDLHGRKITVRLNQSEVVLLEKITERFLNEWSVVNGEDVDVLAQKLTNALNSSTKKVDDKVDAEENISWLDKVKSGVKGRR